MLGLVVCRVSLSQVLVFKNVVIILIWKYKDHSLRSPHSKYSQSVCCGDVMNIGCLIWSNCLKKNLRIGSSCHSTRSQLCYSSLFTYTNGTSFEKDKRIHS